MSAMDCADGLAKCNGGVVEVSLLTSIPLPCKGAPETCVCPWESAGECEHGCVVNGVEAIVPREKAKAQLCVAAADAGSVVEPAVDAAAPGCDEGESFHCSRGLVVACQGNAVVRRCTRGCTVDGTGIDDEAVVSREAATAILCAR